MFSDKRQQRGNGRQSHNPGEDSTGRDRAPLQWNELERFNNGGLIGVVSSAKSDRGQVLYSFEIFKTGRDNRPKKHYDPRDIMSLKNIISEIEVWIENDRQEHAKAVA
jgi:hypothetical protein